MIQITKDLIYSDNKSSILQANSRDNIITNGEFLLNGIEYKIKSKVLLNKLQENKDLTLKVVAELVANNYKPILLTSEVLSKGKSSNKGKLNLIEFSTDKKKLYVQDKYYRAFIEPILNNDFVLDTGKGRRLVFAEVGLASSEWWYKFEKELYKKNILGLIVIRDVETKEPYIVLAPAQNSKFSK